MPKTIAEITVDALIENGISTLYCLPGVQNDVFFDALFHRTDELKPIHTRHEQGAAYMAMGAALATGKPQAFCVVPGPGFLNTTAALSTAYATNAPVLALVGQIPSGAIGKGHGLLHEILDQFGTLRGLTKSTYQISNAAEAPKALRSALSDVSNGRPRPVGIEIPVDMWPQTVADDLNIVAAKKPSPAPDQDLILQAAKMLAASKSPMIVVGGGALDSSDEVQRLSNVLSAPVLAYRNGRGVMPSNQELSITMPVGHALWPKVDVVIGLGTRLQSQAMVWGSNDDLKLIHIDIDEAQLNRSAHSDITIHSDLTEALPALLTALTATPAKREDWAAKVATTKGKVENDYLNKLAPQMAWLSAIRDALPADGIFVDELTQVGYVSRFAFPVCKPRTFISSGYQGTLGYGFATALGAAHARPDVPVVSISGDGGALFTITEMATAVRHNIRLTTIVFNDNMFGNIKRFQDDNYGGRNIACDLDSPDFVILAQSFGARGLRAETPQELRKQLRVAFEGEGPTLIEVPTGEMPSPWDFILMPKNRGISG